MPGDHFVLAIGVQLTMGVDADAGTVRGVIPIRPELYVPGTTRVRTGALVTMLDVVAGHVPAGAINPTVDLRVQIVGPVPEHGAIRLHSRPLRVGRRLVVAETSFTGDDGIEFARGSSTFINQLVGTDLLLSVNRQATIAEASIDELIAATPCGPMALEAIARPRISNGPGGTVQGGAQAWIAEMAVEHAFGTGHRLAAVDLDIRYLNPLRVGPLVATVTPVGNRASAASDRGVDSVEVGGNNSVRDRVHARVALTDAGAGDRLVSHVAISAERVTTCR